MARQIAVWALILAWGLMLPGAARAADRLVHAKDFKADALAAATRQVPIMVLFTTADCSYCERVKREYLWHRTGFRFNWKRKSRRGRGGRPGTPQEIRTLIRDMSSANVLYVERTYMLSCARIASS